LEEPVDGPEEVDKRGLHGSGGVVTRFYSTENLPKRYFRARRN
jgi:hypothetical protein